MCRGDLIKCKLLKAILLNFEMIHSHLPGKQGLAYWQISGWRINGWGEQAAQFSMRDCRRLISACWLAMSCWSFFTKAIKSLMPRNKCSAEKTMELVKARRKLWVVSYHRNHHEWLECPRDPASCCFCNQLCHLNDKIDSNHVFGFFPSLKIEKSKKIYVINNPATLHQTRWK